MPMYREPVKGVSVSLLTGKVEFAVPDGFVATTKST